jgi:hypothetical protein
MTTSTVAKQADTVLFQFPTQAAFGRVLPKNKIYEKARPSSAVKELFVSQVSQITWQYKLAPETINLPARTGAPEIEVFDIALKGKELDERVLACIDKAIPFPLVFQLVANGKVQLKAAYKRPSDTDANKWVVGEYFSSDWLPINSVRQPLPMALDMANLYEQLLRALLPLPARVGEPLREQVLRLEAARKKRGECNKLEAVVLNEKQFNRKVEMNSTLKQLKQELIKLEQ